MTSPAQSSPRRGRGLTLLAVWLLAACSITAAPALAADPPAAAEPQPQPIKLTLGEAFQAKDRVLFVGDELTQQMFYTRAVATALLALKPELDLRFINGGRDGASAATTGKWLPELMELAQPTVVFIALGLNDAPRPPLTQETLTTYQRNLAALVDQVRQSPQVHLVVLLGPPPLERGMAEELKPDNENHVLATLGEGARVVAARRQTGYIDLFDGLSRVYLGQVQTGAVEPLSLGGRLPSETAHMILAGSVLAGLGVTSADLDAIGWSPLVPREMSRVRPVLAIRSKAPDLGKAQLSRELYLQLFRCDEQFFKLWRLSGRQRPSSPDPAQVQAEFEAAWMSVRQMVGTVK